MEKAGLITGASSGIGWELAKIHASKGNPVILVARRAEKLEQLAQEIQQTYGVKTWVIEADLSKVEGVNKVIESTQRDGIFVNYLFNNAGFGGWGKFADRSADSDAQMIDVVRFHEKSQRVIIIDGLDQLVQVQHVDPDDRARVALVILKLGSLQLQVHQDHVRRVHGHDLHARLVKLDGRVRQELLESLRQDLERHRLHRPNLDVVIRHYERIYRGVFFCNL